MRSFLLMVVLVVTVLASTARADESKTPDLPPPMIKTASNPTADGGDSIIAGRVVRKDGKPVPFYGLMVSKTGGKSYSDVPITVRDPKGTFRFKRVKSGDWHVVIIGPGFVRTVKKATFTAGGVSELGTITVDEGIRITGTVTKKSVPVSGATVRTVQSQRRGMSMSFSDATVDGKPLADPVLLDAMKGNQTATTDAKGRYVLQGVERDVKGKIRIEATHPSIGTLEQEVGDVSAAVDFK